METKVIATSKAPAAIGPYVQGIQAGDIVFFSGQLGIDPAVGKLVEGCVACQAKQALKNIAALLEEVGAEKKPCYGFTKSGIYKAGAPVYFQSRDPPSPTM